MNSYKTGGSVARLWCKQSGFDLWLRLWIFVDEIGLKCEMQRNMEVDEMWNEV